MRFCMFILLIDSKKTLYSDTKNSEYVGKLTIKALMWGKNRSFSLFRVKLHI